MAVAGGGSLNASSQTIHPATVRDLRRVPNLVRPSISAAYPVFLVGSIVCAGILAIALGQWLEGILSEPYFLATIPAVAAVATITGWVGYVGGSNAGIATLDFGVIEYDRGVFSRTVRAVEWNWDELGEVSRAGRWFVKIRTPGDSLFLTDNQARAVLSDPRFQGKDSVSRELRIRLQLERS